MNIVDIQALIKAGKIVKITDIDPTKTYIQLGVFQEGNRQSNASNPNTYAPYAIAVQELGGGGSTPISLNVLPVGTGPSIADSNWGFSSSVVNSALVPFVPNASLGTATERVVYIFNQALDIAAIDSTVQNYAIKVDNSLNQPLFYVRNEGTVFMESLPTSPGGLPTGALYNYAGNVRIVGTTSPTTLTDAATVTWNTSASFNAEVTITANRTLSLTNLLAGNYYTLRVVQGAGGSNTLTLPVGTKVGNGGAGAVTLSTAIGAIDILTFYYDGTTLYCNYTTDFT